MSKFLARFQSPLLQNTGSTARDHLASERTFLAWLRTGLGFIALGIGVERFSRLELQSAQHHGVEHEDLRGADSEGTLGGGRKLVRRPLQQSGGRTAQQLKERQQEEVLVAALLGTGTASILYAAGRYFSNFRLMQMGYFKPSSLGAGMLAITVSALAGGAWVSAKSNSAQLEQSDERRRLEQDRS